jgi:DNA primase
MNYYIDKILKDKKITTFLEEKGIYPVKKTGDKWVYHCPVHAGDNDPSFVVYKEGTEGRDYQTYYCFGCHSGITIINLKSGIERISPKESVKFFLKNVKIDYKDARESIINDIQEGKLVIEEKKEIETSMLLINNTCRRHLSAYNDGEEIDFFESFFCEVDKIARAKNIDVLEKICNILIDRHGLIARVEKFQRRREEEVNSSSAWRI